MRGPTLALSEDPPLVTVLGPNAAIAGRITLVAGDRSAERDVFERASSAGEGLLPFSDGRLLVAKEKDPPMLVEFGRYQEPGCEPVLVPTVNASRFRSQRRAAI